MSTGLDESASPARLRTGAADGPAALGGAQALILVSIRRVFGAFEIAESATDPAERKRWLTFALAQAEPTGAELTARELVQGR